MGVPYEIIEGKNCSSLSNEMFGLMVVWAFFSRFQQGKEMFGYGMLWTKEKCQ
jgi:hypothetical protein